MESAVQTKVMGGVSNFSKKVNNTVEENSIVETSVENEM